VIYGSDGSQTTTFSENGQEHNEHGPSYVKIPADGTVIGTRYCKRGVLQRTDGPAITEIWPDGTQYREYHLKEKGLHRMEYRLNGKLHRVGGPALVSLQNGGSVEREEYLIEGKYHRSDGPAITLYDAEHTPVETLYYENGVEISGPSAAAKEITPPVAQCPGCAETRRELAAVKNTLAALIAHLAALPSVLPSLGDSGPSAK
jgi:hypothetical protein